MCGDLLLKSCNMCRLEKPLHDFHKNKRKKDGLDIYCKDCNKQRMRDKYASDPSWRQQKILKTRQYHLDNPEWSKERLREHHVKNAAIRYARQRERLADPKVRERVKGTAKRAAGKRRAALLGNVAVTISGEELDRKLQSNKYMCTICEYDLRLLNSKDMHWDHIVPLSRGGSHTLDNLQPLCAPCNIRKNAVFPLTEDRRYEIKKAVQALRKGLVSGGLEVM